MFETWAPTCDKFFFVLKMTDEFLTSSREYTTPFPILEPAGVYNDSYDLLTVKMHNTLIDIYNRYSNFDWYLKTDDDTYIMMDNLRKFLKDKNSSQPITYGCNLRYENSIDYHSGGAGYVLSKEALKLGVEKLLSSVCPETGIEDIDIAECLFYSGVILGVSKDEYGKERFHPFPVAYHFNAHYPKWFIDSYPGPSPENVSYFFINFYLLFSLFLFKSRTL